MLCIMGDISFAVSFSTFAGISSGPEALLGFRACSCFVTPFSPISRDWIDGKGDGPLVGILWWSSLPPLSLPPPLPPSLPLSLALSLSPVKMKTS